MYPLLSLSLATVRDIHLQPMLSYCIYGYQSNTRAGLQWGCGMICYVHGCESRLKLCTGSLICLRQEKDLINIMYHISIPFIMRWWVKYWIIEIRISFFCSLPPLHQSVLSYIYIYTVSQPTYLKYLNLYLLKISQFIVLFTTQFGCSLQRRNIYTNPVFLSFRSRCSIISSIPFLIPHTYLISIILHIGVYPYTQFGTPCTISVYFIYCSNYTTPLFYTIPPFRSRLMPTLLVVPLAPYCTWLPIRIAFA